MMEEKNENPKHSPPISLYVNGNTISTTIETLTSIKGSKLEQMFSNPETTLTKLKDGRIFIDADYHMFNEVINRLRRPDIGWETSLYDKDKYYAELKHWGLYHLLNDSRKRKREEKLQEDVEEKRIKIEKHPISSLYREKIELFKSWMESSCTFKHMVAMASGKVRLEFLQNHSLEIKGTKILCVGEWLYNMFITDWKEQMLIDTLGIKYITVKRSKKSSDKGMPNIKVNTHWPTSETMKVRWKDDTITYKVNLIYE